MILIPLRFSSLRRRRVLCCPSLVDRVRCVHALRVRGPREWGRKRYVLLLCARVVAVHRLAALQSSPSFLFVIRGSHAERERVRIYLNTGP